MTPNELANNSLLTDALETWGIEAQTNMVFEECGEAIVVMSQAIRGRKSSDDIRSEIADVLIIMMQMRLIFDPELVDEMIDKKMARLEQRLKDAKAKL